VVHGIVKQHEGAIAVSSEPEQGTTFQVFFPCIESSIALEDEEEEPLLGGTERILFVDDEESLVDVGTDMLKQLGYKVTPKSSPVEAWERFRRNPHQFDLVITDYTMPLLTGVDMAREMIHIRPDIPVILCTGFSESVTEEKALKAGIRKFVMKPLRRREIARAIRQVLDSPASSPTGSGSNG